MMYASNRSTTSTTIDYDNVFYNETTITFPCVAFYTNAPPVDEFSAEVRKWRKYYEAVARSREMSVLPLPPVVLHQQVHARPVHSLLFKLRCPRLCPPQKWFVRKHRRKR